MRGIVKKFSDKLGYGFIKSEECDKDIFVHYSNIKMDGYKTLKEGDIVEFDFIENKVSADNVVVIEAKQEE